MKENPIYRGSVFLKMKRKTDRLSYVESSLLIFSNLDVGKVSSMLQLYHGFRIQVGYSGLQLHRYSDCKENMSIAPSYHEWKKSL